MNRSTRLLLQLVLATLAGCASAYAFLVVHEPSTLREATPTITLAASARERVLATPPGSAPGPSTGAAPAGVAGYRDAVARASPSVVTVHSAHASKGAFPLAPRTLVKGVGSGVIIDREGHIVTNHHVVGNAVELAVALADGTLQMTRVVGVDPESDLALLKIDVGGLQPIALADMNDVAVGDIALAVGNPLGVGQTVTQGIVSAIARRGVDPVENFVRPTPPSTRATRAAR